MADGRARPPGSHVNMGHVCGRSERELCSDADVGRPCSVTSQSVILGKLLTPSADLESNPFFADLSAHSGAKPQAVLTKGRLHPLQSQVLNRNSRSLAENVSETLQGTSPYWFFFFF